MSKKLVLLCETCGYEHNLEKTPEIPEHIKFMRCNWCVNCEELAQGDYDEWWDEEENEIENPIKDPNQTSLF